MSAGNSTNQTRWLDEWFQLPQSLKGNEIRTFVNDTDKMGSFSFMWFMFLILALLLYLVVASIYECWFAMGKRLKQEHEEALARNKIPVWVSIYDFHTKLSPKEQDAYLDYSQKMFELQRSELEKEREHTSVTQSAKEKAQQELNWLNRITAWTCRQAHFARWSAKHHRNIVPQDMV